MIIMENNEKMNFRSYFSSLGEKERRIIKIQIIPKYMSESTFYYKLRVGAFSVLEIEKLEEITGKIFEK